jgi:two-component system, NtrC family, sensor kinase
MKLRLISKMTLSTCILLLLTMTLFAWINVETLHNLLMEESISLADKLSETIIKTTHYQMLENDRKRVYEMISEVGTQKDIDRIRLVTKEGLIIFSTYKKEMGTYLDKTAEACNMCHRSGTPLVQASSMNRSVVFRNREGKEVLGLAKAIYNEEKCFAAPCHFHPKTARVLGVLDVNLSLDNMQSQLAANRYKITVLTIAMLGLISLSMVLIIHEQINQPLKKLVTQTEKIAEGNLESVVEITSSDEIGELGASFNIMTQNLKKARAELEDWAGTLEAKVDERTRELNRVQEQLIRSEKLASLGELVAGIAHEINNPLTGILVFTSLLGSDPKLDPSLRSDLDTIIRETERCATIVRGLLEFSRESIPRKTWSSLNSIMDAALTLVKHQSLFQNIDIETEYRQDLPNVLVDPNQVEQVFMNILLNAGQAMPGEGKLTIRSGISKGGAQVFVTITDTGHGIPEENISRIFDPFFTTKENRGTGLGLSVSYGIINNHGGTIEVQSRAGHGTSFTVKLPVTPPTEEPPAAG